MKFKVSAIRGHKSKKSSVDTQELDAAYEYRIMDQSDHYTVDEERFRLRERKMGLLQLPHGLDSPIPSVQFLLRTYLIYRLLRRRARLFLYRALDLFVRYPLSGAALFFVAFLAACYYLAALFLLPQTVAFSYASNRNCMLSPAILPTATQSATPDFNLTRTTALKIGHIVVFTARLCVQARSVPANSRRYTITQPGVFGTFRFQRNVTIALPELPRVSKTTLRAPALSLLTPVYFQLSSADNTFRYSLRANHATATCIKLSPLQLQCRLGPLQLVYGQSYQLQLLRQLGDRDMVAYASLIQTIQATGIKQASIADGETVTSVPRQLTITASKVLLSVHDLSLSYISAGQTQLVPISTVVHQDTITVHFLEPLPRQSAFTLRLMNVTALDDSQLEQPYMLRFNTSGGPRVVGESIPAYGVSLSPAISISFDQPLLAGQSVNDVLSLKVNGQLWPIDSSIAGSSITFMPQRSFPVCAHLTITVTDSVTSTYGITGNSAWTFNARALCYTVSSIGTSVNGRSMTSFTFGSGKSMVLFIGAMHGNEQNSSVVLQKWIDDFDANPDMLPPGRSVVVIPSINPDGEAADTRTNAHGIDLNRNFPSNNWQTAVTEPGGSLTKDGGSQPLSEPESQALAQYVTAVRPRLVLSYHSHAGIVEANDAADSDALAKTYGTLSGYQAMFASSIGNFFDYSTTGAFEDWAAQQLNLPVLVVELASPNNDEFSWNRQAMWAMAKVAL